MALPWRSSSNKNSNSSVKWFKVTLMSVIKRSIQVGYDLRVFFTQNIFDPANLVLQSVLAVDHPRSGPPGPGGAGRIARASPARPGTPDRGLLRGPRRAGDFGLPAPRHRRRRAHEKLVFPRLRNPFAR